MATMHDAAQFTPAERDLRPHAACVQWLRKLLRERVKVDGYPEPEPGDGATVRVYAFDVTLGQSDIASEPWTGVHLRKLMEILPHPVDGDSLSWCADPMRGSVTLCWRWTQPQFRAACMALGEYPPPTITMTPKVMSVPNPATKDAKRLLTQADVSAAIRQTYLEVSENLLQGALGATKPVSTPPYLRTNVANVDGGPVAGPYDLSALGARGRSPSNAAPAPAWEPDRKTVEHVVAWLKDKGSEATAGYVERSLHDVMRWRPGQGETADA